MVVLLSSEPRWGSEKLKLCKFMVKRNIDWGGERREVPPIYCDSKGKYETARCLKIR